MPASQVIVPFLPTCTHGTLSLRDFVPSYAHQYQPLSGTYYEKIIPTTVPGIVVGGLAVLAALLMTIWLFVHTCCKCFRRRLREDKRPQFILGSPGSGASRITRPPEYEEGEVGSDHGQLGRGEPLEQGSRRACNASITLQILIGLFMLATVGTSGWALAISLKDTSYQIPDFWSAVSTVQIDARNANTGLTSLYTDLATLDQNAQIVLQDSTSELVFLGFFPFC